MEKKSKKNSKKVLVGLLIVVIALIGGGVFYVNNMLSQVATTPLPDTDEELGITKPAEEKAPSITNIALFGLDRRGTTGNTRSDSIMIATLDLETKKVKLTSIMRDTYVDIPGRGMDKINHAYAFGGPQLAIRTINENFDMDIRDYVMVDFHGMADIIDVIGGVEIDIKSNEVSRSQVSSAGLQTLTGQQAVAYSRIRYVGNGDFERTERQRRVLEQIMDKVLGAGAFQYPKIINKVLPYVETSLEKSEMLKLGTSAFAKGVSSIEQYRLPVDGHAKGQMIKGVYYLVPQGIEDNVAFLHEYIYGKEEE